ncbi:MAG: hypothetical protein ACRC4M_04630 [Mycoplasma sp.]
MDKEKLEPLAYVQNQLTKCENIESKLMDKEEQISTGIFLDKEKKKLCDAKLKVENEMQIVASFQKDLNPNDENKVVWVNNFLASAEKKYQKLKEKENEIEQGVFLNSKIRDLQLKQKMVADEKEILEELETKLDN